jgi:hypothetical protein
MNYKFIRISVFNEKPTEAGSFHCDMAVDDSMTFEEMLKAQIEPAFNAVFSKLIPDMPEAVVSGEMNPDFLEWDTKYFGGTGSEAMKDQCEAILRNGKSCEFPAKYQVGGSRFCGSHRSFLTRKAVFNA